MKGQLLDGLSSIYQRGDLGSGRMTGRMMLAETEVVIPSDLIERTLASKDQMMPLLRQALSSDEYADAAECLSRRSW